MRARWRSRIAFAGQDCHQGQRDTRSGELVTQAAAGDQPLARLFTLARAFFDVT
jgi:hypothetical protein